MTEPLVATGNGTCDVLMLNSGDLPQTIKADWIGTHEDDPVVLPILVFDLGTRADFASSVDPAILSRFQRSPPVVHRKLPQDLPKDCQPLSGVFISHFHWDHCGNPASVPPGVPVWVGRGALEGLEKGGFGAHVGPAPPEVKARIKEIPEGDTSVWGYEQKGWNVFGDGSFIMLPAPGHCAGHCIAIVRVQKDPDAYFGRLPLHSDEEEARRNLARLSKIHARDDCWIIVAHEREAKEVVPEETWLGDWREKGWKDKVGQLRKDEALIDCWADKMKPQKVVGEESYE
ncbi:hypothetical protein A1Q1_02525 [Trichosporon asahii var. asahii CBS 2479]|uniref:Metallo-beta-lactamase domain-containing protein n=1 Tax=Trichosporon asahii var. asahii (strain ATCC 90039 / CBS 2479 / JCM 2466 / KCTC 7840 / NBRC 103889/ NCYC 2677 / UAMH 7654) TaxID=1186058 RepID=J6EVA5_TRIAS|nr:hypothetical protein A1Q1_02525 [Trichosporon asahii var. asahii CBS 2479]EJT48504.1 hypothetical protein A1Q1_02525 [Trichosporon asahii var. asahii CBS 2479]